MLDWYAELGYCQHTWSSEEQYLLTIFICKRKEKNKTLVTYEVFQKTIKYVITYIDR